MSLQLLAPDGRLVAVFERAERHGVPLADVLEPCAALEDVTEAVLRELPGWLVAGPPELGAALLTAGAQARRHAHVLTHALRDVPAAADPRVVALTASPQELRPAHDAAYGPGHPDHEFAIRGGLGALMEGGIVGPVLPCSRMAVVDGRIAGAAIVCASDGRPPLGGPWLAELFREPGRAGVGAALLRGALAAAALDGLPAMGLAVTEGNRARGLYEELGFELVRTTVTVRVPGLEPAAR